MLVHTQPDLAIYAKTDFIDIRFEGCGGRRSEARTRSTGRLFFALPAMLAPLAWRRREARSERTTEMGEIVEAPGIGNLADRSPAMYGRCQRPTTMFQPQAKDILTERRLFVCEQ